MARDMVALMQGLGHARFAVVGHDRGAYLALRLALDHPDVVNQLVIMEAVPIVKALDRCNARFAASWWHWFFFGQTTKPAERVINADPDAWYAVDRGPMGEEAYADLRAALHDPQVVHAVCEDYRAGLGIDRAHDAADRVAGKVLQCPTFTIWATGDDLPDLYGDVLAVWQPWALDLRGVAVDCDHHIAEERPAELAGLLRDFFASYYQRTANCLPPVVPIVGRLGRQHSGIWC